MAEIDDFNQWLLKGIGRGWVSLPTCDTHDGLPLMPEEERDFEEGLEPCITAMRVWVENILEIGE